MAPRETKATAEEPVAFEEAHDASSDLIPGAGGASLAASTSISTEALLEIKPDSIVLPSQSPTLRSIEQAEHPARQVADAIAAPTLRDTHGSEVPAAAEPLSQKSDKPDFVWTDASKHRSHRWRLPAALLSGAALLAGLLMYLLGPTGKYQVGPIETMQGESALASLLSVGTTSPGGTRTRDLAPPQLIERADALLHAPDGKRDRGEAAFMLKRYIAATLSEERTLWAITQLGSAYAEPGGPRTPDYARAKSLWELSGTLGDPVAMCFLAALHEHGLGTKAAKPIALQWYLRAKEAGGCPGVDDAIARVKK
jgi:hypothetical protein